VSHFYKSKRSILLLLFSVVVASSYAQVQISNLTTITGKTQEASRETKKHTHDSTATSSKGSFIAVPVIITDQNIGYGAILAPAYLHPSKKSTRKNTPPTITGIAGGATTTKTWMAAIMHSQAFKNDQIRYLGAVVVTSVNLDIYELGSIDLSDNPVAVNLKGWGTVQRVIFRVNKSDFFLGPQYGYGQIESLVRTDQDFIVGDSLNSQINTKTNFSALGLIGDYDSRDNNISPDKGFYSGIEFTYNIPFLGATQQFYKFEAFFYSYVPITKWLFSEYHLDFQNVSADAPFYTKPFVMLRGAPAMRYQGNNTVVVETQWRANFYKKLAIIGFVGAGKAFDKFSEFGSDEWVTNYGTGLRYTLTKALNTRVGVDVAWANSQFGWYIVVGKSF
jgi:hypothetical protein